MAFVKAERKKVKMRMAFCGTAGSGKTYSALKTALGMSKKVAIIDTENGSAELYSDIGDYDVSIINAPFTPKKYIEAIKEAEQAGYEVIIIDSLSHAWSADGGCLDQVDKISMNGNNKNNFVAWRTVTPQHNNLVDAMIQSKCHIIATMRSKTDYQLEDVKGKKVPVKVGLAPIQREGMDYEFTLVFDVSQSHFATASKDRTRLFDGEPLFQPSEQTGKIILEWLNSGKEVTTKVFPTLEDIEGVKKATEHIEQATEDIKNKHQEIKELKEVMIQFKKAYLDAGYSDNKENIRAYVFEKTRKEKPTIEDYQKLINELVFPKYTIEDIDSKAKECGFDFSNVEYRRDFIRQYAGKNYPAEQLTQADFVKLVQQLESMRPNETQLELPMNEVV